MDLAVFVNPTCLVRYMNRQWMVEMDDHSFTGIKNRFELFTGPVFALIFQGKERQGHGIAESYTTMTKASFGAGKKISGRGVMHIY